VPTYDREALTPALVHVGVGAFHRAHQALYYDDVAELGISTGWGVVGVSLRCSRAQRALSPQDLLYTVVQRGEGGSRARVVGVMRRYLFGPDDPAAVLAALADARTRVVALTITGAGYHLDRGGGGFDATDPAVVADLATPDRPSTAFGCLAEGLDRRRRAGLPGVTVVSCDNIDDNGVAARTALMAFAASRDGALAGWIDRNVSFPGTMVDRITPATTAADRRFLSRTFGIADRWPVVTEPFSQWIVEDAFANGRPPLDEVGVEYVSDVGPYRRTKTRLLNGSHSAMAYLGYLAGLRRVDQAMADPLVGAYVRRLMDDELTPLLPRVPAIDIAAYKRSLMARLTNPTIADELDRLCARGSTKMASYLVPSLADAHLAGRPGELLALAVAGWFRYLRGVDESGRAIAVADPLKEVLQPMALAGGSDPRPLLETRAVFGDVGTHPGVVMSVGRALRSLDRHGTRATLERYLGGGAGEAPADDDRRDGHRRAAVAAR
jgi:fructuronate reductase/mannitol 2-dehydrogenase